MCFGPSVLHWEAAEQTGTLTGFTVAGNIVPATPRRAAECRCFAAGWYQLAIQREGRWTTDKEEAARRGKARPWAEKQKQSPTSMATILMILSALLQAGKQLYHKDWMFYSEKWILVFTEWLTVVLSTWEQELRHEFPWYPAPLHTSCSGKLWHLYSSSQPLCFFNNANWYLCFPPLQKPLSSGNFLLTLNLLMKAQ